jgi:hypothetical protein
MNMESNTDKSQNSEHRSHRSRRSRPSRHSSLKIWGLSFALFSALVILFISFVYSGSRIEALSTRSDLIQKDLFLKTKELDELKSKLAQSKSELEELIKGRLPSVMKLVPDKVLVVNKDLIKNIVFTVVNHDGTTQYEYKLVVENRTQSRIVPKFRLLIFDKYGVQIGIDQVLTSEELAPSESRSYSSKVDFFMKEEPAYFDVSGTIPAGAERLQSLLK